MSKFVECTEGRVRESPRNTVRTEVGIRTPLGSRIAARFRRIGLEKEIPELRDQPAEPVKFEP